MLREGHPRDVRGFEVLALGQASVLVRARVLADGVHQLLSLAVEVRGL